MELSWLIQLSLAIEGTDLSHISCNNQEENLIGVAQELGSYTLFDGLRAV